MKHTTLTFFLSIAGYVAGAQVQKGDFQTDFGCGINSIQQTTRATIFGGGSNYTRVKYATIIGILNLKYYVSNEIAIGFSAGLQEMATNYYDRYYNGISSPYMQTQYKMLTMSPEIVGNYQNKKNVRLYGTGSIAMAFVQTMSSTYRVQGHEYHKGMSFNFQLSPIGISVGRTLSCYAEIGIGYKGFLNGGLSYRFEHRDKEVKNQE